MIKSSSYGSTQRKDVRIWKFVNDVRLVGELTKVVCPIPGSVLSGWAVIVSHREHLDGESVEGMRVCGPVFESEDRESILDESPVFARVESFEGDCFVLARQASRSSSQFAKLKRRPR